MIRNKKAYYSIIKPDITMRNNLMIFGYQCDRGWDNLIDNMLSELEKINNALSEENEKFEVTEIKEKWGTLRVYLSQYPQGTKEIIERYEKLSETTCEHCGSDRNAKLRIHKGWYLTRCDKCWMAHIMILLEKHDFK
jgi:hypothetical protein